MIPRRIMGASHWLGAPADWKPGEDGDCGHLAIRTHGNPRFGHGYCESAWEPSPKELEHLNAGGSVILRVMGWQPPVALYVEKTERVLEPVGAVKVEPSVCTVCPKCEGAISPLTRFCTHNSCPMR